jgi:hypothetical protein
MATWIELRCERRGRNNSKCHSNVNSGPMDLSADTRRAVIETLRDIERDAIKGGWRKLRDGWVCPACLKEASPITAGQGDKACVRATHTDKLVKL